MAFRSLLALLILCIAGPGLQLNAATVEMPPRKVEAVHVSGNRITRDAVILREITIEAGQLYDSADLLLRMADSKNRLINLGIFNEVNLDYREDTLHVIIRDRMPVFGYPRFALADRNFNQWWETKDFSRSVYGIWAMWRNVGGWNHRMTLQLLHGYTEWIEMTYRVPFRTQDQGFSWTARSQFTANHEVWHRTDSNRLQFLNVENAWGQIQWNGGVTLAYRPHFFTWFEVEPAWQYFKVADTVVGEQGNTSFLRDGSNRQHAAWLSMRMVRDTRVRRDYPVGGSLLRLEARPMQIMSPESVGKHLWFSGRYSAYVPVEGAVWVFGVFGRYATGKLPYTYGRVMGYGADYVRGYEPYVADGNGYILFKTAYRIPLLFDHHVHPEYWVKNRFLRDIPLSAWLNVFADAGRVIRPAQIPGNEMALHWMSGLGIGLDVLAFYDRMVRFELSMGGANKPTGNLSFINAF